MSTRAIHILNTLRQKLDDEGTFDVVKVYETEKYRNANKVRVYVNIISDDRQQPNTETAYALGQGAATCGIFADWIIPKDTTKAGTGASSYGDTVEKIEVAIAELNDELNYNGKTASTANFSTTITGIEPVRMSGFVDDLEQEGRVHYEVRVHYVQTPI